ncbi:hypothetical protein GWK47_038455 [Chionoecetes opilio]|uniref:Uncharacterized protein n=1 Tax=Chionoecetes opilio TaxID=41210 RepID=A0A8J4YE33_CHIOP|nr:hypothetical protein GWK47_038455 [Chionoecetes opilio]
MKQRWISLSTPKEISLAWELTCLLQEGTGHDHEKATEVWLLGHSVSYYHRSKTSQPWRRFTTIFLRTQGREETCSRVQLRLQRQVLDFWTRARIPTIAETSVRRKITGLFDEWKILSKSKNNSGVTPAEKQKTFQESLPDLLDIAHSDALTLMTIPEDKEFLLAQRREGRRVRWLVWTRS